MISLVALLFTALSDQSVGTEEPVTPEFWGPRNAITYNVLDPFVTSVPLNLEIERAFMPQLSAFVELGGWSRRWYAKPSEGWAALLVLGVRFYPAETAPSGFYVEGAASASGEYYFSGSGALTDANGTVTVVKQYRLRTDLGAGAGIGYSWVPWKRLMLSLAAGALFASEAVHITQVGENVPPIRAAITQFVVLPLLRASVGYAF